MRRTRLRRQPTIMVAAGDVPEWQHGSQRRAGAMVAVVDRGTDRSRTRLDRRAQAQHRAWDACVPTVRPNAAYDAVHLLATGPASEHFTAPSVDPPTVVCSCKVELPLSVKERDRRPKSGTDWRGVGTRARRAKQSQHDCNGQRTHMNRAA